MLESGVVNLDRVLGGGIPEGDVVLVTGPAGSGKTTLSFQIAFHAASAHRKAVYVSTLSEPPARIARHLRSFRFFLAGAPGTGKTLVGLQYEITGNGLKVLAPLESVEGILTGIARLPSELRVKRGARRPAGDGT